MRLKDTKLSRNFVTDINLYAVKLGSKPLSNRQQSFIAFCIIGMTMLGCFNFTAFTLASFGFYGDRALSWMLHHSNINWSLLSKAAVIKVIADHNIFNIHLVIDDTDRTRSKVIKVLWGVFKTIDKVTGGFINAQNIVFLCLVTEKITFPIMFTFYRPDPNYSKWIKKDKKLRKKGVKKKSRPKAPSRKAKFPTRIDIAINLILRFKSLQKKIESVLGRGLVIKSILFDSAYLSPKITKSCHHCFPNVLVVSQITKAQIVWDRSGKEMRAENYFNNQVPVKTKVNIRGEEKNIWFLSARLTVKSHGMRLMIVALKYEGETEYRYLAATELTWRSIDIIRVYALRWLIEVVNFDWKQNDGWGRKAFQRGADGACRGMILSLLTDCFLLTHPVQLHQSHSGLPLWTAGSVVKRIQYDNILETIQDIFASPDPEKAIKEFAESIERVVKLMPSSKHMVEVDIADLGPTKHLQRRYSHAFS